VLTSGLHRHSAGRRDRGGPAGARRRARLPAADAAVGRSSPPTAAARPAATRHENAPSTATRPCGSALTLETTAAPGQKSGRATSRPRSRAGSALVRISAGQQFSDKREVLFYGQDQFLQAFVDGMNAAPPDAFPLEVIASALQAAASLFPDERRLYSRTPQSVIDQNPALQERELHKLAGLATTVAEALRARRIGEPTATLAAGSAGATVFGIAFTVNPRNRKAVPRRHRIGRTPRAAQPNRSGNRVTEVPVRHKSLRAHRHNHCGFSSEPEGGAESVLTPGSSTCHLPAETAARPMITQTYEGTNQIQRMVLARQLLK
jgi:hypothetical protein